MARMESVYFDLGCGKEAFFPDCPQDPLASDVTDTLWPLLDLPPSESSSPIRGEQPAISKQCATSCTESQDDSAQVMPGHVVHSWA